MSRAVLIGIDEYPFLERARLRGAVNDADAMAAFLLRHLGFTAPNVRTLKNQDATREAILGTLADLVDAVVADELVILQFSGHGSQRFDPECTDGTGWLETLVPFDSGRSPRPNRDITCREIGAFLRRLTRRTRRVVVVFDCCHAGTSTRSLDSVRVRGIAPDLDASKLDQPPLPSAGPPSGLRRGDSSYTFWAACRSNELALEIAVADGVVHGALTYHLLQAWQDARADETYRDVFERLELVFRARFQRQHPQLEGAADRRLFGLREIPAERYIKVRQRVAGRVVVSGGAAHQVDAGSCWAVYPAGARATDVGQPLGRIDIESVGAVVSEACLVDESEAGVITAGCRAIEVRPSPLQERLVVHLSGGARWPTKVDELREGVVASPFLRWVTDSGDATIFVRFTAACETASVDGGMPDRVAPEGTVYKVTAEDGSYLMPVRSLDRSLAIADLVENLEARCRWRRALSLRNREQHASSRYASLVLSRVSTDGTIERVVGDAVFDHGERFALAVHNHASRPLHAYVLHFGIDGEISLIYPPSGAWQPIAPGGRALTGVEPGDELSFVVGEHLPYDGSRGPIEVAETIRVIATTEATDLLPLFQGAYRLPADSEAPASHLEACLRWALSGRAPRDVRRRHGTDRHEFWATSELEVRIRRGAAPKEDAR